MTTTATVAAIYARLSRDDLHGTDREGESVEAQVTLCREYIARNGWTVGEIYIDNNVSATSGATRPAFERMLKDAPPLVVYRHQDRLERGYPGDLDRFLMAGCEGDAVLGTRATLADASSELVTRLWSIIGRHEQRLKGERIQAANRRFAEAGRYRGNIRPFGQELNGSWVPAESEAVREAVRDILDGTATFYGIARRWNEAGLLTAKTGTKGGNTWTTGTVRNYFTKPRLMGFQEYKGELYPLKDWKSLMSPDEFEQMQSVIRASSRAHGHSPDRHDVHLLSGILTCQECGRGMGAKWTMNKGYEKVRAYRCPSVPPHTSVVAHRVESIVRETVLDLMTQRGEHEPDAGGDLAAARADRRTLVADHDAWMTEAAEAGLRPAVMAKREASHAEALARIDAAISEMEAAAGIDILRDNGAGWDDMPKERLREIIRSLFSELSVPKIGKGRRFKPEMLRWDLTPLGERYRSGYVETNADDDSSWAALRGREPRDKRPGRSGLPEWTPPGSLA